MPLSYTTIIFVVLLSTLKCNAFSVSSSTNASKTSTNNNSNPHLIFPGGGIFFYWQAGVITYLREKEEYRLLLGGNLSQNQNIQYTGASAGALCATLTATNVDFVKATELALSKSDDAGVWDRPLGLQGIWGSIIEEWLHELIPEDAAEKTQDKVSE